jgi:antitoxin (DNA-binding transcriptional repressor) of toxin-antitoxin stability system
LRKSGDDDHFSCSTDRIRCRDRADSKLSTRADRRKNAEGTWRFLPQTYDHAVSVSELKGNLLRYLDKVQRGSEVQVLKGRMPIARLVGLEASPSTGKKEDNEKLDRLERTGMIRRGTGNMRWVLEQKALKLPGPGVLDALSEDREDRF